METFATAVGNFHHYNPTTGLLCNCQWGAPDEFKSWKRRTASQAVRAIRNQNQKRFRTPHGQRFLNALERHIDAHHGAEPLAAWLASRYKHGDITVTDHGYNSVLDLPEDAEADPQNTWHPDEDRITMGGSHATGGGEDLRYKLPTWVQWMQARQHPLRRGVNVMEKTPREIDSLAQQLQEEVAAKNEKKHWLDTYGGTGAHAHKFDPAQAHPESPYELDLLRKHAGWTIRQLRDTDDCEAESQALGHCIGDDSQNYKYNVENGNIEAYSLRDPDGYPKVTWHFNPDGTLAHLQGKSGYPKQEWRDLISMYHDKAGKDDDEGGYGNEQALDEEDQYDRLIELDGPDNIQDYLTQYHPEGSLWDSGYLDDYNVGDDTEIELGQPNWERLFEDAREQSPEDRENFFQTILWNSQHPNNEPEPGATYHAGAHNNHAKGFNEEVGVWAKDLHPDQDEPEFNVINHWNQTLDRSYHPMTGEFVRPEMHYMPPGGGPSRWETVWGQMNKPLFTQMDYFPNKVNQPAAETPQYFDQTNPEIPEGVWIPPAHMGKAANILDPIHDTLEPRVWDNPGSPQPRLKAHHKRWIEKTIWDEAKKYAPNPEQWLQLVITGSLTTHQYSDKSDIDVSLFINPHMLPDWDRGKLIGQMITNVDGKKLPGTPFELQAFVVGKNISPHDLYQMGLRSGYDLDKGHWLVPPDRSRVRDVEKEYNSDYVYALESADKMERLLRYDPERAVDYWHQIHKRRRRDQSAGKGDYSQANIVYKFLANRGLFPQIAEASGEYIASAPERLENCPKCGGPYATAHDFWQGCRWCGYKIQEEAGRAVNRNLDWFEYPDPSEVHPELGDTLPYIPRRQGSIHTADKLNDFLMDPKSRPDLQTPEAQQWLQYLQAINTPQIDPMTPWLTREWKKKRINFSPQAMLSTYVSQPNPHEYDTWEWHNHNNEYQRGLAGPNLSHWADWYNSNHPTRRGVDLMQMKMPDMHAKIDEWDQAMAAEAEEKRRLGDPTLRGETVHKYPNGWSMQRLHTPQSLKYEGDTMGHCVGGYAGQVEAGDTMIYSLRDHKNIPHVTMEVSPKQYHPHSPDAAMLAMNNHPILKGSPDYVKNALDTLHKAKLQQAENDLAGPHPDKEIDNARYLHLENVKKTLPEGADWESLYHQLMRDVPRQPKIHKGDIEQIQGQGNTIPKPEYQAMVKEFMETMDPKERPAWPKNTVDTLEEIDEDYGGYHAHGDYGVDNRTDFDWEAILMDAYEGRWGTPDPNDADKIVDRATQLGELSELANQYERTLSRKEEEFVENAKYDYNDQEIADWAGLDKEEFTTPNPDYDPEDDYGQYEPEYQFDEDAWDRTIEDHRREYAQERFDNSPEAEWLYHLDREIRHATKLENDKRRQQDNENANPA